ncbi:Os08g0492200 [Oryza sativa Japonica Group]|uniref:Os08g0492200 protein n=3 Tax=Oryza sativa TaxID=4530 RepID=B9G1J4_ORYSJ|nr:hypothetical protein OsI_29709 [Oryza sativa Indica Group]EEE68911.1 hypothetical protein OsJ_27767 [Oryza sativa Japonica Group]BAT06029.1 Os08g0492200 [Oryza sativa Japonica Group]
MPALAYTTTTPTFVYAAISIPTTSTQDLLLVDTGISTSDHCATATTSPTTHRHGQQLTPQPRVPANKVVFNGLGRSSSSLSSLTESPVAAAMTATTMTVTSSAPTQHTSSHPRP